jgi:hypothetical protein
MGVRHTLFPVPTLGATSFEGCRLPDAILHGKRSFRPRSRAVPRIAAAGLLSEAFQLASTGGGATGRRTRSRPAADLSFASRPLSTRSATAFGRAFAPCHGSRLFTLRLHSSHSPAVFFSTSPAQRKVLIFHGPCLGPRVLPGAYAHFVPAFAVFHLAD